MPPAVYAAGQGIGEPFRHMFAVTPHDVNELPYVTRALYIGGAGDVAVVTDAGDSGTFAGMSGGSILPGCIKQVKATGTTATLMIGLY